MATIQLYFTDCLFALVDVERSINNIQRLNTCRIIYDLFLRVFVWNSYRALKEDLQDMCQKLFNYTHCTACDLLHTVYAILRRFVVALTANSQ